MVVFAEEYPVISPFLSVKTNKGCLRERMKDSQCDPCFLYLFASTQYKETLFSLENVQQVLFPPLGISRL